MRLYYSPGACSLAVHIALREAERSFELVRVDLHTHRLATGEDYCETVNRKGHVPALQLDGPGSDILTEGQVVLQYVGDLVPEKRLIPPWGTFARYHMMELLSFIATEVHKQFGLLFHPETPSPVQERQRGKIGASMLYLQDLVEEHVFLTGETFTVADAYLYVMLRWANRFGMNVQLWPNLDTFMDRVAERPSVQAALVAEGLMSHRMRRSA